MESGEQGILSAKFGCLAVVEFEGRSGRKHASTGIITTRDDQRSRKLEIPACYITLASSQIVD